MKQITFNFNHPDTIELRIESLNDMINFYKENGLTPNCNFIRSLQHKKRLAKEILSIKRQSIDICIYKDFMSTGESLQFYSNKYNLSIFCISTAISKNHKTKQNEK